MGRFYKIGVFTVVVGFLAFGISLSCTSGRDFEAPVSCTNALVANASFDTVKELYTGSVLEIKEDYVVEAYVTSSDEEGNFFGELYLQDHPQAPTQTLVLELDLFDSYLFYPPGSKVLLRLKGLYLGYNEGLYRIGGTFTAFGNVSVGRLPATQLDRHLFKSCGTLPEIVPKEVALTDLDSTLVGILVRLPQMEVILEEVGLPYAEAEEETLRHLQDCEGSELLMRNSGYADFQAAPLPDGSGSVTGILQKEGDGYAIQIRNLDDMDFGPERCPELVDEFTSPYIFISELADPENDTGARFVELYNADTQSLSLKGWQLQRYTNANTSVGSTVDLSDYTIEGEGVLLLSPNEEAFESIYGFPPDIGVGTNSPADSNGDDNLVLLDPFGTVIDIFGVIGEDGSGTAHEFEDGRALRNAGISRGNPTFDPVEWTVWNDTGAAGTIDTPQLAPDDYSPGIR